MATNTSFTHLTSAFSMYKKNHPSNEKKIKKQRRSKSKRKLVLNGLNSQLPHSISIKKFTLDSTKYKKSDLSEQLKVKVKSKQLRKLQQTTKKVTKSIKQKHTTVVFPQTVDENERNETTFNELPSSDNPELDALRLFKWMIDPILPDQFFNQYWEQKVLHIKRFSENYYQHILNSSALDKIIRHNHLNYTRNVDVVCYENGVKEVHNSEGRATSSALWDYYFNGCSIRVLNPQTYSNKVHLLLSTLQEYFGAMVGANVYLTPPNSQGFAPHYDDIEAFILQLEGRKHWKLYKPKNSDVLARYSSPNLEHKDIGNPLMELTLNAGELLYFPRGTIHEGYTDANSHSLHITVSVYQQTSYTDLLEHILPEALKRASEDDVQFRMGLPLDYQKHFGKTMDNENSKEKNRVISKVHSLLHSLVNFVDIDLAVDLLGKKFMYDSMPPVLSKDEADRSSKADGPYLDNGNVIKRVEISLDTRIRLLRFYCIRLVCEKNCNPKLYYNTENATVYHGEEEQWLELEPEMIPSVSILQKVYPSYIEVEKLPLEDATLKMQLVSDLWEHGLIVTDKSLKAYDDN